MATRPAAYKAITPYLIVPRVPEVIKFLQRAFDAEIKEKIDRTDGSVMHAEVCIGDSMVMMGEPNGQWQPMPASLYLYVDDSDASFKRAIDAGGESVMEPTTMTHAGQRYGGVKDPGGNIWWVAMHLEDVLPEEQQRRAAELGI